MSYKTELQSNNLDLQSILNAVNNLPEAGGGPVADLVIEPLTITENGTYTAPSGVDGYSPVVVNVPSSGGGDTSIEDGILAGGLSVPYANNRVTKLRQYGIAYTSFTSVSLPNVTTIGLGAFYGCSSMVEVNLPALTAISNNSFVNCSKLKSIDIPKVTSINSGAFSGCSALATVVLRRTSRVSISGSNNFANTPIASGTGYIYVPLSLVDSYKSANIWSNYAAQFRALEDYTVDGTIAGELDESKI